MIYFIYQDNYCEASEINDQLASKITYITKEEYIAHKEMMEGLEEQKEEKLNED